MTRGRTVLQVPVPELEPFVLARHRHYDRDFVSADPRFVHAHITALGPFLAPERIDGPVRARIAEIASATKAFGFRLAEIDTFPNGVIHLVPDPEDPFRTLTADLFEAFPSCPPYAAEFPDVRPHLTLDALSDNHSDGVSPAVTVQSTRELLGPLLPATCRAERLDLAWWANGDCRILGSWQFGPTEARDMARIESRQGTPTWTQDGAEGASESASAAGAGT